MICWSCCLRRRVRRFSCRTSRCVCCRHCVNLDWNTCALKPPMEGKNPTPLPRPVLAFETFHSPLWLAGCNPDGSACKCVGETPSLWMTKCWDWRTQTRRKTRKQAKTMTRSTVSTFMDQWLSCLPLLLFLDLRKCGLLRMRPALVLVLLTVESVLWQGEIDTDMMVILCRCVLCFTGECRFPQDLICCSCFADNIKKETPRILCVCSNLLKVTVGDVVCWSNERKK